MVEVKDVVERDCLYTTGSPQKTDTFGQELTVVSDEEKVTVNNQQSNHSKRGYSRIAVCNQPTVCDPRRLALRAVYNEGREEDLPHKPKPSHIILGPAGCFQDTLESFAGVSVSLPQW